MAKKKELPKLDDEFAKDVSEFDTLEELKNSIKEKIQTENDSRAKYELEENAIKTVGKTILTVALAQALLFSIIAITRIPIGRLTIPMVLTVYMLSLAYCTSKFEKDLANKTAEENSKD